MQDVKMNVAYDLSKGAIVTAVGDLLEKAEKPKKIIFDFATGTFQTSDGMPVVGISELIAIGN